MADNSIETKLTITHWETLELSLIKHDLTPDVYTLLKNIVIKTLKIKANSVTKKSIRIALKSLSILPGNREKELELFEISLQLLKIKFGFESPNIPVITEIKNEKPVLTPSKMYKSNLSALIFYHLEQEQIKPTVKLTDNEALGRLCLWLICKEHIYDPKLLVHFIKNESCLYRIEDVFYFERNINN